MSESRKRVRHPAVKRDPLIEALIRKLPPEQAQWPVEQRFAWLRMAVQAFDVAYGPVDGIELNVVGHAALPDGFNPKPGGVSMTDRTGAPMSDNVMPLRRPTAAEIAELDEARYYIDKQGFARGPGGGRVKPTDVPGGTIIEDERPGENDLDSIVWADGSWPVAAFPPGLNFAAA